MSVLDDKVKPPIKVFEIKTTRSWLKSWKFENIQFLEECASEIIDKLLVRPKIKVFGKECHQQRNVGFFSDESIGYKYSGTRASSIALTDKMKELLLYINTITNSNFNGILVNQYKNGEQYIGAHSDDESGLGNNGVVAISLGGIRKFRIRSKTQKGIYKDISMKSGLVIHMGGNFQKEFTHEIPIEKRVNDERISFTFRHHSE